jgi:hypothetical protein
MAAELVFGHLVGTGIEIFDSMPFGIADGGASGPCGCGVRRGGCVFGHDRYCLIYSTFRLWYYDGQRKIAPTPCISFCFLVSVY